MEKKRIVIALPSFAFPNEVTGLPLDMPSVIYVDNNDHFAPHIRKAKKGSVRIYDMQSFIEYHSVKSCSFDLNSGTE